MARLNDSAALAVLMLMLLVGIASVLIPLYSDEIAVQMVRSRFFWEKGALLNLLPQCRGLTAAIPVSWYPAAVANALLYGGADALGLRLRGIAICAGWLALLWIWAGKHPQTLVPKSSFQGLILSLNMVGVLPFVLVLARSEQLLVVALIAYGMFPKFWPAARADAFHVKGLKAALFVLITSVFLQTHPKALFFAPIILASAWLVFRRAGKAWIIGIVVAAGFTVLQSFQYAQESSRCANAPLMTRVLAQHTLDFQLLASDKAAFFKAALVNLTSSLGLVMERVPAGLVYQSNWLPSVEGAAIAPMVTAFGVLLKASLYVSILLLMGAAIFRVVVDVLRKRLQPETLMGIALVASLMLHGVVYNVNAWHFYTPGLVVPALAVLLMLVLHGEFSAADWARPLSRAVVSYWMLLAIVSMALLLAIQAPRLLELARAGNDVIAGQPLSTPVFVRKEQRASLSALAKQCGIKDGDDRLVLDGGAYFRFQSGRQPINVLYVSEYAFGMDIGRAIPDFLKKLDAGGVLSRCEYLPKALRDRATVSDKMCCVSKSDL